jgi:uncharacterized membrane protein YedE/YeeE
VSAPVATPARTAAKAVPADLRHVALGAYFGFVLIKAEVISWYRIQEMFRFDAFHMYGVIGSAIAVGALTVWLVRRYALRAIGGRPIAIEPMPSGWRRYAFGGLAFGFGWALTGACPGPIAALIGAGLAPMLIVFASALLGTIVYGLLEKRLPH